MLKSHVRQAKDGYKLYHVVIYPVYPVTILEQPLAPLQVSIMSKRLQDVELQQRTRAAQKIQAKDPWNLGDLLVGVVLPKLR